MPDKQQIVLSDGALIEIEALSAKVPDGPWFAAPDEAEDVPDHRRSGLALVDTGRSADWWIARLCEWRIANFIAASKTNVDALCQTVRALMDLAYVPKVLPDDETITYYDQAERLLREKVARGDEVRAVLDALGEDAVDVREDGGPEDIYASLAVSVARLKSRLAQVEQDLENLQQQIARATVTAPWEAGYSEYVPTAGDPVRSVKDLIAHVKHKERDTCVEKVRECLAERARTPPESEDYEYDQAVCFVLYGVIDKLALLTLDTVNHKEQS